ncbi:MAG TPA: Gfo/Idh/MocA family oxidoreductase [Gemmatimonadota bacterium]|nr:Gfo/Idh/MocA family oxidoreductase [Gemmatimonadota bacterium]
MARDIRVAVIGAGGVAQVVHLPILKRLPDLEVAAIVDPQRAKARTIADRFGVEGVLQEVGDLASVDGLDAVVICTPNDVHEENAITCLEMGLHVLCERPISTTSASARRMIGAAEEADRQLMVAMNQRFRYDARAIRQFVASGELGDVFFVRSSWLNRRVNRPRRGWKRLANRAGGGVLMDLGVQAIDLALWLAGYPRVERVSARVHRREEVEDSAVVLMAIEDGSTVSVEVTWELMEDRDRHAVYVLGTRGSASTSPFRVLKELETGLTEVTPPLDVAPSGLYTAAYRQEWAYFLRRVRGERPREVQEDQIHLLEVVEACYASVEEEREVSV